MKQRLKSYKFWVAFSAAVIIFVQALGELFGFSIDEQALEGVILGFCGVLVVCGIVDKPNAKSEASEENSEAQNVPDAEKQNEEKKQ